MKTDTPSTCSRCGDALSPSTLDGYCPKCIGKIIFSAASADEAAAVASAMSPASRNFGQYELLEEIARGGMGVVFKARHLPLNRTVAVKMMLTGRLAGILDTQRFQAEAEAVARLQHPNIVPVHEIGEHDGFQFFSMDYVDGVNLAELVRRETLSTKRAAAYLKTVAEAIRYAHGQGIVHRDLKPSNILIDASDQPRVTDFGLAKRMTDLTDSSLTITGQVLGTPAFIPPEQAVGEHSAVGACSDIYSLGAVLYFTLTRQPPFSGRNLEEILSQVVNHPPISLRRINPSIPRDLEVICLKCLEKKPQQRYLTAQELADDLGRYLRDEPIVARPVSRFEKIWRTGKRQPAIVMLSASLMATLVLLLALLAGHWSAWFGLRVVPDMPTRSANGISGIIDGKLYVTTPADGTSGYRNNFHIYDPQLNDWKKIPEPPIPHGNGANGVINGKLYVVGGYDWNGTESARLDVFDPLTGTWANWMPIDTARSSCAGVAFEGKLYVVSGGTSELLSAHTFESYDPNSDAWTIEKPLPTPRNNAGVAIMDGKLIVIGGVIGTNPSAIVERYDFSSREWSSAPSLPEGRYFSFVAAHNNTLFTVGGFDATMHSNLWSLRPGDTQWHQLAPMPEARYGGDGAQILDGKIWCIGGWSQDGAVHANIFIYDPKLNSWASSK